MRSLAFILALYVTLALEVGLKRAFELGATGAAPSFMAGLAAFVALLAPEQRAVWLCMAIGLALDLSGQTGGSGVAVIGPHALGYALGAQFVLSLRGVLVRRNPLTISLMSVAIAGLAGVVVVAFYTVRGWFGYDADWSPTSQLVVRLGSALYSAVSGLLLGLVLSPLAPVFGWGETRYGSHYAAKR